MNVSHPTVGPLPRAVAATRERVETAQAEMVTGRLADPVGRLGAGRAHVLSWEAEAARLERIVETNVLASGRLNATQLALDAVRAESAALQTALVGAVSGALDRGLVHSTAVAARAGMTESLNGTFAGDHLFAGVTGDVVPIGPPTAVAAALEARFAAAFGHGSDDPTVRQIAPEDAAAFARDASDWLQGPGWSTVSQASDTPVAARIAPGERIAASVSANEAATRAAFSAAFVAQLLFGSELSDTALGASAGEMLTDAVAAEAGLARLQGSVGLRQARIERADERLSADAITLRALAAETLAVDPFDAAQRFNAGVVQLETAYALTARLNELSLMRFL